MDILRFNRLTLTRIALTTIAFIGTAVTPVIGQGGKGAAQPQGAGQSPGSSPSPQGQPASSPAVYRIESDMLAYQAADVISAEIASEVKGQRLLVYDAPTFENLQFYEAYSAELSSLESGFSLVSGGTGATLNDFAAAATAAQTIVSSLAAMRSSTEYGTQQTSLQVDALIAQLSSHLAGSGPTIVPKFLLETPEDITFHQPVTNSNCAALSKSIPDQLSCLLRIRAQAAAVPANAQKFQDIDKLFQPFFANLLGVTVASSLINGNGPQPQGQAPAQPQTPAQPQAPATPAPSSQLSAVPMLATVIMGHRLAAQLDVPDCSTTKASATKVLVVEATAAGGSYRIRHNFWVEVFWTTPSPSYNGGAIVTYLLIDPCTSTIVSSNTLRYMYDYGKFEKTKKLKSRANFTPTYEPQ
jgi:hypothetical protein